MFSAELQTLKTAYEGGLFGVEIYTGNEDGVEWFSDSVGPYIRLRVKQGAYEIEKKEGEEGLYWISATGEVLVRVDGVTNAKKWLLSKLASYDNITLYDSTKDIVETSQDGIEFVLFEFELRKIDDFTACNEPCLGC